MTAEICNSCGKGYKNKQSLYYHRKVECGKKKTYKCVFCNYFSKRPYDIKKHCVAKHPTEDILNSTYYVKVVGNSIEDLNPLDIDPLSNLWTERKSIFPNGLENLLKSLPDGQLVLLKKEGLDNQSRQKLVKVIIDNLILQHDPGHKYPAILQQAAEEIVELFPGERMESYFIPYTKKTNSNVKNLPRGKLYSRWVNSKRALTIAKSDRPVEGFNRTPQVNLTEKEKASYNSLLYSTGDSFEQIMKDWKQSYNMRMMKLKTFDSPLTYLNTFPALRQTFSYKLLLEDFNLKYPNTKDQSIHKIWPAVASSVLEILRNKQMQVPELYSFNVDQSVLSLKVFPWLFQPTVLRDRTKNKNIKLSRVEMAERFFLHAQGFEELEVKLSERANKFREFTVSLQPYMVAVGPLQNLQAFYVMLDSQRFMFNDCLTALDTTLKIFFALDIPFPSECKTLWQTIDQLVYKINKSVDPGSSVALSELEHKLKK